MEQLKAVVHAARLQFLEPAQNLADGEAELRAIASRRLPPAASAGGELDPHADDRPHAHLLRVLEYQVQLRVFLDDGDDVSADILRQHGHLDEFGVLEAVADNRGVVISERHNRQQLRLGSRLEPETVRPPELEDFLHNLALLIDLDGIDTNVSPRVFMLGDGALEGFIDFLQPVLQDVPKPDERRQTDAAELQIVDQLFEIDRAAGVLGRVNPDLSVLADREVSVAPSGNFVQLGGIVDGPGLAHGVGAQPAD